MRVVGDMPAAPAVRDALYEVADVLGLELCWLYQRRWHFPLRAPGWTVAISADSAGRIRVDACLWTEPASTVWCLEADRSRLAAVVAELADQVDGVGIGA